MKKILLTLTMVLFLATPAIAKKVVVGTFFFPLDGIDMPLTVSIYSEDEIMFRYIPNNPNYVETLTAYKSKRYIEILQKGLEWMETAKREKVDIYKSLGSVKDPGDSYKVYGGPDLLFRSTNKGAETYVVMRINGMSLFLNADQTKDMIVALERVPQAIKEFKLQEKEKEGVSSLFK